MYHPVKTIQDFTKSLAGLWLNPRTKSKFYFSADKSNPAGGEINVLQQGAGGPVSLHFNLSHMSYRPLLTASISGFVLYFT